jgi:hypothetical protein
VGCDDLPVRQFHVCQETLVAPQETALYQIVKFHSSCRAPPGPLIKHGILAKPAGVFAIGKNSEKKWNRRQLSGSFSALGFGLFRYASAINLKVLSCYHCSMGK